MYKTTSLNDGSMKNGQPKRRSKSEQLDEKAFRIGFQLATLLSQKEQFEQEKMSAQAELQNAMQQMMQMQAASAPPMGGMPPGGEPDLDEMMPPMGGPAAGMM